MADGKVVLDLAFNKNSLNKSFNEVQTTADRTLSDIGNKAGRVGGSFKGLATSVGGVATKLLTLTGSIVGVGNELRKVVNVGASFEQGMAKVGAISGATGVELEKLTEKAKDLGRTTQKSSTEVADAFKYMAQAGWKTEEMLQGVDSIINLSIASGEELANVSDIVTDALTGFGLQAQDTAKFADILAKTASSSNTNIYQMGESFKYVATTSGALGYSIEDTALAIGLLANNGIKGSLAGTSLRTTLTRLSSASGESKKILDEWNISLTNSDGSMKPLLTTLTELRQKFATLTQEEQINIAKTLVGQEALSGFLALMNSTDESVSSFAGALANANGEVERQTKIMEDTTQGAFERYKSSIEGIRIAIFNELSPSLTALLNTLGEFFNGLTSALTEDGDIITFLLDALIQASEQFKNNYPQIVGKWIDGLIVFWQQYAPEIIQAGLTLFSNLALGFIKSIPVIVSKLPLLGDALLNGLETIRGNLATFIVESFNKGGQWLKENWKEVLIGLINITWNLIKIIIKGFKFAAENIWTLQKIVIQVIKNAIINFGKWLMDGIVSLTNNIVSFVLDFPNKIVSLFTKMKDFGKNLVINLWAGISERFLWLKDKVTGFFSSLFSFGKKDTEINFEVNRLSNNSLSRELQRAKSNLYTNFTNAVAGNNRQLATAGIATPTQNISTLNINFDKYISKGSTADEAFFRQAEFYRRQVANGKGEK